MCDAGVGGMILLSQPTFHEISLLLVRGGTKWGGQGPGLAAAGAGSD